MVKRGRRVGHSGLLVAQQLERCGLGADGASGLRSRHLLVGSWSRWAFVCQTRSVDCVDATPRRYRRAAVTDKEKINGTLSLTGHVTFSPNLH